MTPFERVVRTKIVPPQRRVGLLRRPRLVDFLHENLTKKVVLISAAPGYGKTSLLVDFLHDSEVGTTWYGLDASDADPWTFVEHLAASVIESYPQLGEGPLASHPRDPGAGAGPESLLRVLVNEIQEKVPEFFAILVDDYQHADPSAEVGELLAWFLDHQPDNCCLVLATRTMPALPFLRLTARQEIAGLGSEDLAFTADEIQTYLQENHSVTVSRDEAEQLARETEGWITAILLSTHTLWKGLMRSLAEAQGKDEQIFAYLAQEVFEQQPKETQSFLRSTSILNVLRPDFCNGLLRIKNSADILESLEQDNLFVTKLASPRGAYRYHGLFQDFLKSLLEAEAGKEWKALHRAAGRLLEKEDAWEEALEHYVKSGADKEAVAVLDRVTGPTFASGRLVTLARWLDALSPQTLSSDPALVVMRGRIYLEEGETEQARDLYQKALEIYQARGSSAGEADVQVRISLLQRLAGRYDEAMKMSEEVLAGATESQADLLTRATAHRIIGDCHHFSGDLARAKESYRRALSLFERAEDPYFTALLLQNLGTTARRMGNHLEAEGHYARALEILEALRNPWRVAEIKNNIGVGHHYQGEYERARQELEEALAASRDSGHRRTEALVLSSLGDVQMDLGSVREARGLYEESLAGARETGDSFLEAYNLCALADLYGLDQAWEHASALLDEAERASETAPSGYVQGLVAMHRGIVSAEQGLAQEAAAALDSSAQLLQHAGAQRELARALLWHANALYLAGQVDLAFERLRAAIRLCEEIAQPHLLVVDGSRMPALIEEARRAMGSDGEGLEALALRISQFALDVARRPSETPRRAIEGPRLEIRGFGDGLVRVDGKDVPHSAWGGPLVKELFFYILERGPVRREVIVDIFWPEYSPGKAKSAFHATLYRMRRVMPKGAIEYRPDDEAYFFDRDLDHWYDVSVFEQLLRKAQDGRSRPENALRQVVAIYRGQFLSDIYSDWCLQRRETLRQRFVDTVADLASTDSGQGRHDDAIRLYRLGITEEPYREDLHRGLMQSLATLGRQTEAAQHYVEYAAQLREELSLDPTSETTDLYDSLAAGEKR